MNKILKLISNGAFTVADSFIEPRDYVKPSRHGFQQDNLNLRGDVRRVGSGMNTVTVRYGKQSNKPSGSK